VNVNHNQLSILIKRSFEVKQPLFIWGATGVGKSFVSKETFEDIAKENKRDFVEWNKINDKEKQEFMDNDELRRSKFIFADIRMSQMDSTDFKGLPKLDGDRYVEWLPPLLFRILSLEGTMAGVFFDEFNTSVPSVQSSCMQLILDREIGEISLSKDVYILAAGNRGAEDRSATFDISAPLLNRFSHVTLSIPTVSDWTIWALKNGIDERIIGFLNFQEGSLFKWNPELKDKSFPTPRSNAALSRYIKGVNDKNLIKLYSSAMVGDAVALQFVKFVELGMKINLDEYLEHPERLKKITEIDMQYAIISSAIERYRKKPEILPQLSKFIKYFKPEFSIYTLKMIRGTDDALERRYFKDNIRACEVWNLIRGDYEKFLIWGE